jgi:hypothetical protein
MLLQLTEQEAQVLHDMLHDYLPALRREVAHTDAKEFRRLLLMRQNLAERLLEDLSFTAAH